ncbi:hypothetical protein TNCV_4231161 [Trichonephila clavipes]|uniref:Uncharacterized protein n=1 Tax=Trichonephila clavipes TaxID=2585209 RepID=A0A8X6VB10_TRICX|nr:hypothetical protein TNCV_4231161 [Trichonephila clavipes]
METATGTSLTYQELYSNGRSKLNSILRSPPAHPTCTQEHPLTLCWKLNVTVTSLARLTSSHLKCVFNDSDHPTCQKCSDRPGSPDHILRCIGLSKGDLISIPLLAGWRG